MNPAPIITGALLCALTLGITYGTAYHAGRNAEYRAHEAERAQVERLRAAAQQRARGLSAEHEREREAGLRHVDTLRAELARLRRARPLPDGCVLDAERLHLWRAANAGHTGQFVGPLPSAAAAGGG